MVAEVKTTAVGRAPVSKQAKAKKATAGRKTSTHPPFFEMISDAIVTLKERTGSSQYAITKYIEEKHKQLPPNFRKLLLGQLKKLVASGKLTKVKASYKLSLSTKSAIAAKPAVKTPKVAAAKGPKRKIAKVTKAPAKPKAKAAAVSKAKTAVKAKSGPAKTKVKAKSPAKVAKTSVTSTPGKKTAGKAKMLKKIKAARKVAPKATSVKKVKTPAKKKTPARKVAPKATSVKKVKTPAKKVKK